MKTTSLAGAFIAIIGLTVSASAFAQVTPKPAGQAKISMTEAIAIAVKARPGDVTDKELEKESGGSGLRYSFDIRSKGVVYEVGVDAMTGKVLENSLEGAHPD